MSARFQSTLAGATATGPQPHRRSWALAAQRRWLGRCLGVVGLAGLCLVGCNRASAEGKGGAGDAGKTAAPLSVSVAAAQSEELTRKIELTGTLAAWEEAVVSVEADGRLVQVKVDLGSRVKKGDVLAQIAPAEYSIRTSQAEADLEAAKADLGRMETLVAKDLATRQQLDEARRRFEMARTNVDMQKKKLGDTAVRAPIDGVVSRRMVNLGEYVRTGAPAFQIVLPSPLKFKGDVPERYAPSVKIGDAVEAAGEALGSAVLHGEIARIGAAVSADTRSFPIEARIDNPGEQFKPGSFAHLSILTGTKAKVVTVPETAVSEFAGNKRVFVVDGAIVHERRIEIEGKVGDRAIVSKGLEVGERVAITAADQLSDGAAVAVRTDAPSGAASSRGDP